MSRPFRALHVIASSWAVPMHILPLARALVADGWEVDIASPGGPEIAHLPEPGIRHIEVPFSRALVSATHVKTYADLRRLLSGSRYDVVHTHGIYPSTLGRAAAACEGVSAIYHCRGTFFEPRTARMRDRALSAAYRRVEARLAKSTAVALTLNSSDAADLIASGMRPERVQSLGVGGCGLDLGKWSEERFTPEQNAQTRRRLGIPGGDYVIGFVGRVIREKGVLELFEAFRCLRAGGKPAHLLMIGGTLTTERDQKAGELLRSAIVESGLGSHVTFTGHIDEPAAEIAAMDVLVLPSYREGFGQVLIEAGALGRPVVASRSRGAREAVLDGETGLLVPKQDPRALEEALLSLIDDPSLASRLGRRAAERAREKFGRDRVITRIRRIYRELVERVDSEAAVDA